MMQDFIQYGKRGKMRGPLPKGSRALIRLTLESSIYPVEGNKFLSMSKTGIAQLPVRLEIASGGYAGYYWYDRITASEKYQRPSLTPEQIETCRIGELILRAILESAHGIRADDMSARAQKIRNFQSWRDFDGLIFPAKLDIDDRPITRKDGRQFWRNRLKYVLPVTDTDYQKIMAGGEYISKGTKYGNASAPRDEN